MRWIIAHKSRGFVRLELYCKDRKYVGNAAYINIEGTIRNGFEWCTGTKIFGMEIEGGKFREKSVDKAIVAAIDLWKRAVESVVESATKAPDPFDIPVKSEVSNE